MSNIITHHELLEIVPDLQAMAAAEPRLAVKDALNRLVDRYTALSSRDPAATPAARPVR